MNTLQNRFLAVGGFFGFSAVIIGAMGAHFLKDKLSPEELVRIETGVRYQMYHAIALTGLAFSYGRIRNSILTWVFYLFTTGVVCFSFSLYALIVLGVFSINVPSIIHLITPLGGVLLTGGWMILSIYGLRRIYVRKKEE
ncbi:MAG TPA: DUF423 domain-containing protein [Bacteroidia bacterium]|nr:DUF423 domain-containing protein [Bacteroidia bacterium]